MTQEIVTAREVAASAVATPQYHDAQIICDRLDQYLSEANFRPGNYSIEVRSLFKKAWDVAHRYNNSRVTVFHLACALVSEPSPAEQELSEFLECESEQLFVGCALKFLGLGSSTGDADPIPPSVGAVRWLGVALALASRRGNRSELLNKDLVQALRDVVIPGSVLADLRSAALRGKQRRDAVLGPRPAQPEAVPPRDIMDFLEVVNQKQAATGQLEETRNIGEFLSRIDEFDERCAANWAEQKGLIEKADRRLALIEQRVLPMDDVRRKLEMVDRRIAALPQPPSGTWLAAAIAAVLALGAGTGLILTQF